MTQPKHIFIGGANRSGTTLLQKLLVLHSNINGGPEFDFLPNLLRIYRRMKSELHLQRQGYYYNEEKLREEWREFLGEMLERQHPPAPLKGGFTEPAVPFNEAPPSPSSEGRGGNPEPATQNPQTTDAPPLGGRGGNRGATYFSEKTPDNIHVAKELLEIFPEALFIYMYRDGRDVLNSLMNVKQRMKRQKTQKLKISFTREAMRWNSSQKRYRGLQEDERFVGRHFAIQFEALLRNPQEELQKLMDFLGLEIERQQLEPEKFGSEEMQTVVDKVWYTEKMYRQPFKPQNIGRWQRELTWQQKLMANLLMGEELSSLGYSPKGIPAPLQQLFKTVKGIF